MKLNLSLIGILISCIAAVNGATTITGVKTLPSKTLPVSTSTLTSTTTITGSKTIPSKTLPISSSTIISTPTIPIVTYNPEEPWYVGSNGNYHVIKKYYSVSACKLKDGISRSLEEYKECLDAIGISDSYYKDYIKYYGAKTTKTVPAYKVNNPYKRTCPAKGGWVVQFEKPATEYCKKFDAYVIKVSDEENCNDNLYVCDASYPSIIKDKLPSKSLSSFSATATSTKIILPTVQATSSSDTKCCTGDSCTESDYKCCQTDQPVVVNLVDKLGVWGIQAFEKGYDWCLYKDISPIITTPKSNVFVFYDSRGPSATVTLPYYVSEVTVSSNSGEDYRLCEGLYCYDYYGEFNNRENTFTVYTKQNYPITTVVSTKCSSEDKCSTYTYSANPKPSSISINILPGSTKAPLTTRTPSITTTTTTTTAKVPLTTKTLPITTTTTTTITTTTTKVPLTTKTIPCEPVTVTVTERETFTQKEKVTVTVTIKAMETTTTKCADKWGQCGGANYNGPTCCSSGSTCHKINEYYSQCV